MPTILAINPRSKGTKTKKKKGSKMAKAKRGKDGRFKKASSGGSRKAKTKTKTVVRYRNPTTKKKVVRKAKETFGGVNVKGAVTKLVPLFAGFAAAHFTARKFGDADFDGDSWSWKEYLLGPLGAFAAAMLASSIFKARGAIAEMIFAGGLAYTAWLIFQNELVPEHKWLDDWFGESEDLPLFDDVEYGDIEDEWNEAEEAQPGDLWEGDAGDDYVMGDDWKWYPVDNMHRMNDDVEPFDPNMGDDVEPFNPTMGDSVDQFTKAYAAGW